MNVSFRFLRKAGAGFAVCKTCGTLVDRPDTDLHREWHRRESLAHARRAPRLQMDRYDEQGMRAFREHRS
jgi:hypothetical protein